MTGIYVVITDLDRTLLDESYSLGLAAWFIKELERRGVPVVFCTSKSRAEVEYYRRKHGFSSPFITENGAAIFVERKDPYIGDGLGDGYITIGLGVPAGAIHDMLRRVAAEAGIRVRVLNDMASEEISVITGLPIEIAGLAAVREYSVVVLPENTRDVPRLAELLRGRGLSVSTGSGRLYSITGPHDKGVAVERLRRLYINAGWEPVLIGLGDGYNDVSMLRSVDYPVVMGGGTDIADAVSRKDVVVMDSRGPLAWMRAVSMLLGAWRNPRSYGAL